MAAMDALFSILRHPWATGFYLGLALSAAATPSDVEFSILLPEADRVYLLGSFNDEKATDDTLMTNEQGLWRKTVALEEGSHTYYFQAEGDRISDDGWRTDWRNPSETRQSKGHARSVLAVPGDLDAFRARHPHARLAGPSIEIPLIYDRHPENSKTFHPSGYSSCPILTSPPAAGQWKLPEFIGPMPLYSVVQLGDSRFLAVLDRQTPADAFYNRLFFDRNGNGDLTDDEPLAGDPETYGRDHYFSCSFPPLDLEIQVRGQPMPYAFRLRLHGSPPAPDAARSSDPDRLRNLTCSLLAHCSYLGEFALDGTAYRLALADSTANGIFGDALQLSESRYWDGRLNASGDSLFLSTAQPIEYADGLLLGEFLAVGKRLFQVRLDLPAQRLTLDPVPGPVGTLELPAPMRSLTLVSVPGQQGLMAARVGTRVPVPAGDWRLAAYQLLKKDEWGDEWILHARGHADAPPVGVSANGSGLLAAGEPLHAFLDIPDYYLERAAAQGSLRMSLRLAGHLNETITDLRRLSGTNTHYKLARRDSNRPEEAAYRIIRPDGERITSGSFEYG